MKTVPCTFCGTPITRPAYKFRGPISYCDSSCRNKHVAMKDRPEPKNEGDIVHIPLSQNQWAKVDRSDYESMPMLREIWTAVWSESARTFYALRRVKKVGIYMHRHIMNAPEDCDVNHWNHDGLDNTRKNLVVCSHAQNLQYSRKRPQKNGLEPTSKFKGVSWAANEGRWVARIKNKLLGYFDFEDEAAIAYNVAAAATYGEFARINQIPESSDFFGC